MMLHRTEPRTCTATTPQSIIEVININRHLAFESILAECQHGLQSQRTCETQLVQFVYKHTDLDIMNFAKAFDLMPWYHTVGYYTTMFMLKLITEFD